jgi:chemotaxis protein methyltransferase CheR
MNLAPFKELIKRRCGLLFEGVAEKPLVDGLNRRMMATSTVSAGMYLSRLASDDHEFHELVCLLTINETYFYREAEQLHFLVEHLLPRRLAAKQDDTPLRILSAGCSTGEEPYSIAIALREKYGEAASRLFTLTGGDIDKGALDKARAGRYTEFSFRGLSSALRDRYFDQHGMRSWTIKENVRRQVTFHQLNLLATHYPNDLHNYDVIFFRNVSIYFDEQTRRIIQQQLSALLKKDGVLIVGIAETLANDLGVLHLAEENELFYFTRQPTGKAKQHGRLAATLHAATPALDFSRRIKPDFTKKLNPPAAKEQVQPTFDSTLILKLIQEKNYDAATALLATALERHPDDVTACLLKAQVMLHRKDYTAVDEIAQRVLQTQAWSVDAAVLLGLSAKWRNLNDEAVKWFKQAVYASQECWPAHYYLGELYRSEQRIEPASRAYRMALQFLNERTTDGLAVIQLGLPAGEVRFLCVHQLAKLNGAITGG